ncbi:MAG: hypothetical protein ABIB04_05275 [Patescibacteria group bacterium]
MNNKIAILSVLGLLTIALPANAAIFKSGDSVDLGGNTPITENVYVSGGMITVKGDVNGDINAAGGNISIGASSTGDIHSAGGMIEVTGNAQDVRIAGGFLNVDANISGDLFAAGGFLRTKPDTVVYGDIMTGTGAAQLDGVFKGKALINGGEITLSGKFEGPIIVNAEKVILTSTAELMQGAKITAREPAQVADGAMISGDMIFEKMKDEEIAKKQMPENSKGIFTAILAIIGFAALLCMFIGGLIGLKLFKSGITARTDYALRNFWLNLLIGFASLILFPIATVLLFMTIIGSFVACIVLSVFILVCILAKLITIFIVGALVWKIIFRKADNKPSWKTLLIGLLVYYLLMMIPIIGWFFGYIFFCVGLGTIVRFTISLLQKASPQLAVKEK